jgi:NAD(P)-dependent dehydrogenase (short-subunit alcohol dehydrogenase family)
MAAQEVTNVRWDFSDHVVLITGAARGQGRAHALGFARAGADVVICDIGTPLPTVDYPLGTKEELEAVAEECRSLGVRCLAVTCDVGKSDQVRAMVDAAVAQYGQIDVLVNNAGVESVFHISELTEEAWDDLLNTNLKGVFLCSKYVSEHMIKGKDRLHRVNVQPGRPPEPGALLRR